MKWFERRRIWLPALAVIVAVGAFACDDGAAPPADTPAATPRPTTTASDDGTPSPTPSTPIIELPPGVLGDFPVYPGAELLESEIKEDRVTARYQTADSRQDVSDFYQGALAQDPWVVQFVSEPGEETTLVVFSDVADPNVNGTVAIRVPPDGGDTEIIVEIVTPTGVALTPTPLAE